MKNILAVFYLLGTLFFLTLFVGMAILAGLAGV